MRPAGFAGGEICEWDRFMKRFFFLLFLYLPLLLLSGCAETEASRECFAMDTVMQLRAYGPQTAAALDAAEQEIYRLEGLLSCQDPEAELARCNTGSETVSEETAALIQTALDLSAATGGAYDPTLYPLTLAWGFSGGQYRVPDEAELSALRTQTGAEHVQVDGCRVRLDAGTQLDLGGIAKGYTAGRIRKILQDAGVRAAIVSLGGNVAAIGKKPGGGDWIVGLQDPQDPGSYFGTVAVSGACVVTSGGYQRYFEQDGVRYHHILDPKTGRPAASGLQSVSVVSQDDTLADALSTALFVMGLDAGAALYRAGDLAFEAVFMTDDGSVWITPGLAGQYQSDRPYQVLQP